jgi:hypothetical protein
VPLLAGDLILEKERSAVRNYRSAVSHARISRFL